MKQKRKKQYTQNRTVPYKKEKTGHNHTTEPAADNTQTDRNKKQQTENHQHPITSKNAVY
jgi:hypothetical protein